MLLIAAYTVWRLIIFILSGISVVYIVSWVLVQFLKRHCKRMDEIMKEYKWRREGW